MASQQEVKEYLAYWLQLGKRVVFGGGQEVVQVRSVIQGNQYSPEFEASWQKILAAPAGCYLEGTDQTIQDLLSEDWVLHPCSRCFMPVPLPLYGITPLSCPCSDIPLWPNTELPLPRSPVDTQSQLATIRDRLGQGALDD